jgi:hypothetical protein
MADFCGLEFVNRATHLFPGPLAFESGCVVIYGGFPPLEFGVCFAGPAGARCVDRSNTINHRGLGVWSLEFGSLGLFGVNQGPRAFPHITRALHARILCLGP